MNLLLEDCYQLQKWMSLSDLDGFYIEKCMIKELKLSIQYFDQMK